MSFEDAVLVAAAWGVMITAGIAGAFAFSQCVHVRCTRRVLPWRGFCAEHERPSARGRR